MSSTKKINYIVWLGSEGIHVYDGSSSNGLYFQFTQDFIRDYEVVDPDKYQTLFSAFIEKNKIEPGNILFVIAPNLIFEKTFQATGSEGVIKNYIDEALFENVSSHVYLTQESARVVIFNRDFYDFLTTQLSQKGFTVNGAVPYFVVTSEANPSSLQKDSLGSIYKSYESFKQQNIIDEIRDVETQVAVKKKEEETKKKTKKDTYILLAVFGVLLLVLIILVISQFTQKPQVVMPTRKPAGTRPNPSVIPSISGVPTASVSGELQSQKNTTITVQYVLLDQHVQNLVQNLKNLGYENVTTEKAEPTNQQTTLMIYSPDINEVTKNEVMQQITPLYPESSFVLSNDQQGFITIKIKSTL